MLSYRVGMFTNRKTSGHEKKIGRFERVYTLYIMKGKVVHMDQESISRIVSNLSPRLKETLAVLLQGISERQCAERMGVSPNTMHDYVRQVFHHFGVRTRPGLMSVFVNPKVMKELQGSHLEFRMHELNHDGHKQDGHDHDGAQVNHPFGRLAAAAI